MAYPMLMPVSARFMTSTSTSYMPSEEAWSFLPNSASTFSRFICSNIQAVARWKEGRAERERNGHDNLRDTADKKSARKREVD